MARGLHKGERAAAPVVDIAAGIIRARATKSRDDQVALTRAHGEEIGFIESRGKEMM